MKIPGRIKALIVMAIVIYVLGHMVRAVALMLVRPVALLHPPRSNVRLEHDDKSVKQCSQC